MCTPVEEGVASAANDSNVFLTATYLSNISYEETGVYNVTGSLDPYRRISELLSTKVRPNVKDPSGYLTFGSIQRLAVDSDAIYCVIFRLVSQ